uniref:Olfactory receptor n=1 Tax=Oryzias latipes TaxID=8090 RepID=A0A3P9IN49_ORYLA
MNRITNTTYITLDGYVEIQQYKWLYFIVLLTAYVLIICSNLSIVCIIVLYKELNKPMYIIIAALLVNSVFFSTNIYPKLLIDFLSEKQVISYPFCLMQLYMFYSLSFSELLLLAIMAFDRYMAICKPLRYPTIMRQATVSTLLVLAWLVPACHFGVQTAVNVNSKLCRLTVKAVFCNNGFTALYCAFPKIISIYGVMTITNIGICPLIFVLFSYTKILIVSCKSCGKVKKKAAQTCLPHLLVLFNFSLLIVYHGVVVRVASDLPNTFNFIMTIQIITCHPLFNPFIYGLKINAINKYVKMWFTRKKQKWIVHGSCL